MTGIAYMAPMIVLGTFGVVSQATKGNVPTAYTVTLIAMLFTAYSYGRMASEFPVSGSAYTYVGRAISAPFGFLAGWVILLDYFFLPLVIWLIGSSFLQAEFPNIPIGVWIISYIFITSILNIIGIRVATGINSALMVFQFLVLGIFIILSLIQFFGNPPQNTTLLTPIFNQHTTITSISAGAALAAYSFIGFDAVTTLAEETYKPEKNIPKAVVITALTGGLTFVITTYAVSLIHPGSSFANTDSAAFEIAKRIGGTLFAALFLAGMVVTQLASGIAAQTTASRLLFTMGRDNVLPHRIFAYLSPRFQTPVFSILLIAAVGLFGLLLDVSTSTSFINFGAFTAFTLVNISIIYHYIRSRKKLTAKSLVSFIIAPAIGASIDAYLLYSLDTPAHIIGGIWLIIGLGLLCWLTRLFSRPLPNMNLNQQKL